MLSVKLLPMFQRIIFRGISHELLDLQDEESIMILHSSGNCLPVDMA
jgi:hypothetical protein